MNRRLFVRSSVAAAVACALPYGRLLALDQAASQAAGGIPAVTGSGAATVIEQAALRELKAALRGGLLLAGDPGYDQARRVLNESIDRHPALVVQPTGVGDVRTAVNFARDHDLLLAVKCGGHSTSGKSTCEGGMQIDLSRFRAVRVNPVARRAFAAGGSLLGELDHEAMAFGLVTTSGTVSHTGIGGLTLGGGFGRLARRFGLALDNVLAVDMVNADGGYRHASPDENPELYWGVRGGGGNFGIVTSFEFGLHPMRRQIVGGSVVFPLSRMREILEFYGEFSSNAPDELYVDAVIASPIGGAPGAIVIAPCYSGPPADAERVLAPLRKLGTPIADTIKTMDYVAIQRSTDRTDPRNEGAYMKEGFIRDFQPAMVNALIEGYQPNPERGTIVFFQHAGGAIGRVAADATAFAHRHVKHGMFTVVSWKLDRDPAPHIRYIKDFWATLEPFTLGRYTNSIGDEPQKLVSDNYGIALPRLQSLKKKYDPANLFRLNANIQPA
ncbi:MAG: FAD-binding oxidoreductase [Gammaproteobacteria bacterium]